MSPTITFCVFGIYAGLRLFARSRWIKAEAESQYGITDELLSDEDVIYWRWKKVERHLRTVALPLLILSGILEIGWFGLGVGYFLWAIPEWAHRGAGSNRIGP